MYRLSFSLSAVLFCLGLAAQGAPVPLEGIASAALGLPSSGGATLFSALTEEATGISFVNPIDTGHPDKRLYVGAFACGGIALGDVDGDGRPDIFLTSGPARNRLYRNAGHMKFEDITVASGLEGGPEWSAGATMVFVRGVSSRCLCSRSVLRFGVPSAASSFRAPCFVCLVSCVLLFSPALSSAVRLPVRRPARPLGFWLVRRRFPARGRRSVRFRSRSPRASALSPSALVSPPLFLPPPLLVAPPVRARFPAAFPSPPPPPPRLSRPPPMHGIRL